VQGIVKEMLKELPGYFKLYTVRYKRKSIKDGYKRRGTERFRTIHPLVKSKKLCLEHTKGVVK
jgi:hypothetical protein